MGQAIPSASSQAWALSRLPTTAQASVRPSIPRVQFLRQLAPDRAQPHDADPHLSHYSLPVRFEA